MKTTLSLVAFLVLTNPAFAADEAETSLEAKRATDLPKLAKVEEGIFRSGRPTEKGLTDLQKTEGLRTIINLEDSASNVKKEEEWAKKLGIQYFSFPTSAFSKPNDEKVEQILTLLDDPTQYPILIHCQHGQDRTGMMVGLRRVFFNQWTPKDAYKEMLDMGFHTILQSLDKYFKEKTGYQNVLGDFEFNYFPKNQIADSHKQLEVY